MLVGLGDRQSIKGEEAVVVVVEGEGVVVVQARQFMQPVGGYVRSRAWAGGLDEGGTAMDIGRVHHCDHVKSA